MRPSASRAAPGTVELVHRVARDARELLRLELDLAKDEARQEFADARSSAVMLAVATALGATGLASLVVAFGLVVGSVGALALALALLVSAAACGLVAYRRFPTDAMAATSLRIKDDEAMLRETGRHARH